MTFDLNSRARKILEAVVSEYLETGDAVGSRTLSRRGGIDLSAATVRNVMSDLEGMGLLRQPHTSSGRLPTGTGLRFFIDSFLKIHNLSEHEKSEIRRRLGNVSQQDAMQLTSRLLSEITHYAGVVLAPNPAVQKLRHIEFVPLSKKRFLCIMVTDQGTIENKIIQVDFDVPDDHLDGIHRYLKATLSGLTLGDLREKIALELDVAKQAYDDHIQAALALSKEVVDTDFAGAEVIMSGKENLITSAMSRDADLHSARDLMAALEEREVVLKLLDQSMRSERIQVFLGAETASAALQDAAVVAVPYGDDTPLGAIAVVGPTRMNYSKVMGIVDFTAKLISEISSES